MRSILAFCLLAIMLSGCIGERAIQPEKDTTGTTLYTPELYPAITTIVGTAYITNYGGFNVVRNSTSLNDTLTLLQMRRVKAEEIRSIYYYNYTNSAEWVVIFDN